MTVKHWSAKYIGIPFEDRGRSRKGADCWGLVRIAMSGERGIALPDLSKEYSHAKGEEGGIAALIEREGKAWPWQPVDYANICPFDLLIFKRAGSPLHVALAADPDQKLMLHIVDGAESHLASYGELPWSNRFSEALRHKALA